MPSFTYTARDRTGERASGELEAADRRGAVSVLRGRGLTPIQVTERAGAKPEANPAKRNGKSSSSVKGDAGKKEVAKKGGTKKEAGKTRVALKPSKRGEKLSMRVLLQFSIDLRDLLSAGMTLGSSMQKLSRQSGNPARSAVLKVVHEDIVQGKSLSEALKKHPRSFPEFYTSVIRAGEAGGQLQQALENAVRHYERAAAAREQMVGALVYPCIVAVFGVLTIVACLIWVIPQFTEIFIDLKQALPWPTALLIAMSDGLMRYGLLIALALGGLGYGFHVWRHTDSGRYAWDGFLLKVPVFSRVIRTGAYANFARTLSNLLTNGVPVLRALDIVQKTVGNAVLEKEIGSVKSRVTDGASLSRPLAESGVFPEVFTDMLAIGEEAGEVPRSLAQIARRYDDELTRNIKLFTTVIEPVLMIFIAGAVGFVAISMLLPVFQLSKGIQ
ncbi:MAG: type II secretion system F family protein [Verrucomicrobia bacterium]|nr:type II secretion system F family protein [Verrucomicrobiota bacterium]MCH8528773.1 type II secretion system F family protein [Kiritimatiellia bacterium]